MFDISFAPRRVVYHDVGPTRFPRRLAPGKSSFSREIEFARRKGTNFQVQVSSNFQIIPAHRLFNSLHESLFLWFFFRSLSLYLCIAHDNEQNASCISVADRPIEIQSQSGTLNVRVKNVRDVLEESVGK